MHLSRIWEYLFSTKPCPQHSKQAPAALTASRRVRPTRWRISVAPFFHCKGTPKPRSHLARRTGCMAQMGPYQPGAARRSGFGCMAGRVRAPGHPSWSPFGSAPQSSCCSAGIDDAEKRTVHYIKAASTGGAKRTGAGPDHLLIGTVALFRMGKRVPVAEHHFRHPGAPWCGQGGQGRHPALFRLLARRQRAGPGGARLSGHPSWAGGPALGRWACRYRLTSL